MNNKIKAYVHARLNGKHGEFLRYSLVGAGTVAINFLTYFILYKFIRVNVTVSNCVAVIFANAYSYLGNKRRVFHTHCENIKTLVKEMLLFFVSRAGTMLLEVIGVPAVIRITGELPMLAKIEVVVFIIILNYIISKFIVFHNDNPIDDQQ